MRRAIVGLLVLMTAAGGSARASALPSPVDSVFNPDRDLPGFNEMRGWKQVYMLAPYFRRNGNTVTDAERTAIVKEWEQVKPRIVERHRAAEGDPFLARVDAAHNTIANTNYLSKLKYRVIESTRPFAFFVEVAGKSVAADDLYLEQVQRAYTPYLRPFLDKLDQELAPLANKEPKGYSFIVWVLESRDSYVEFEARDELRPTLWAELAHFSPVSRWAYTYFRGSSRARSGEDVQILLHELVHAYVDWLAPKGIASVKSYWMNEGLAEYLSYWRRREDGTIQFEPSCSPRVHESLSGVSTPTGEVRIKLEEMLAVTDPSQFERLAIDVVNEAGVGAQWFPMVLSRFYADAYLLLLWLEDTQQGRFKPALRQLLTEELSGRGGAQVAKKILAEALDPSIEAKLSVFARELAEKSPPTAAAAAPPRASPSAVAPAARFAGVDSLEKLQSVSKLLPVAVRAMQWMKFSALGHVRAKECFPEASSDLKLADLVTAETERLLKRLQSGKEEVSISKDDKGRIVEISDSTVTLDRGGGKKPVALPRSSIAPDKLCLLLRSKGEKTEGVGVSAAVLAVLSGQSKQAREVAQQRVKKDPTGSLDGFLAVSDALADELNAMRTLAAVLKESDATTLLNAVRANWPQLRETQVATGIRDELAELLVERITPAILAGEALQASVHGKVALAAPAGTSPPGKADGAVSITYDFDDAGSAQDFVARVVPSDIDLKPQPLSDLRRQKAQEEAKSVKAWTAGGGCLRTVADGYCEFRIPLRGDFEVEVFTTVQEGKSEFSASSVLWYGIRSDDGKELGAVVGQFAFMVARNGSNATRQVADGIPVGKTISGRLRLSRRMLSFALNDGPTASDPFLFNGTAHLFFYAPGSDAWRIEALTLRANPDDFDLQSLVNDVARARVAEALAGK